MNLGAAAGSSTMKAKQLIGPEQIKIMSLALEGAWARIASGLSDRKVEIEHNRLKLAQTIGHCCRWCRHRQANAGRSDQADVRRPDRVLIILSKRTEDAR
jgi:hypothetical protein